MNILIPDSWLREHLQTKAKPSDIQKYLSLSGPSVERIYEGDVYDIEVTTNRVDSMSVRGIAREAATILKRAGIAAKLKPLTLKSIVRHPAKDLPLPEIIYETEAVHRVLAVVLTDLQPAQSPETMQERLKAIEVNVHDALIDISNYITHELGHPCHVFDYDKIMAKGGKIIIKEATKGKSFVTLDEVEHRTLGGEIVFESENGEIIDLPAIKGTLNTGVDRQTTSVLFWIESLDAKKVRQASMGHAIRTVAAQLNEKNVDPHLGKIVMEYGVMLMEKLCQAKIASSLYDYFPNQFQPQAIVVKKQLIENYLGIVLIDAEITSILTDLDCQVTCDTTTIAVTPPTFRPDLQIPADIIEELARIYGYHQLPSKLMSGELAVQSDPNTNYHFENLVKHFLADQGWQEIYSYSLVSKEQAEASGHPLADHLGLSNPLKEETTYLRRSLIPSLVEILELNPSRKELSIFELACVYHPKPNDLPTQPLTLALLSSRPYRQVRGDLENLLTRLYVFANDQELLIEETNPGKAKVIITADRKKTTLGTLQILEGGLTAIELDWKSLLQVSHRYPRYQKLSNTAAISEELTFTVPEGVAIGPLMTAFKESNALIKSVELKSIYQANYSFGFVFQDPEKNISTTQVEPIRQKLVTIATDAKLTLVGAL